MQPVQTAHGWAFSEGGGRRQEQVSVLEITTLRYRVGADHWNLRGVCEEGGRCSLSAQTGSWAQSTSADSGGAPQLLSVRARAGGSGKACEPVPGQMWALAPGACPLGDTAGGTQEDRLMAINQDTGGHRAVGRPRRGAL